MNDAAPRAKVQIIPAYVQGGPCHPRCRWCEPTQGMPRREDWRVLTGPQLDAAISTWAGKGGQAGTLAVYGTGLLDLTRQARAELYNVIDRWARRGVVQGLRCALRPDQVSADLLLPLRDRGLDLAELEVPSLWPAALSWLGPAHHMTSVGSAVELLKTLGIRVAIHTTPGLPGADAAADLETAEAVIAMAPVHVRVTPVVLLKGSTLDEANRRGVFKVMGVREAVELGERLLQLFEEADVPVVRFGWQPTDLKVDVEDIVGGAHHPSLRTVVESRRMFLRASQLLQLRVRPGQEALLRVHPSEATYLRGLHNANLLRLRQRFRCRRLEVAEDPELEPGTLALHVGELRISLGRDDRFAS